MRLWGPIQFHRASPGLLEDDSRKTIVVGLCGKVELYVFRGGFYGFSLGTLGKIRFGQPIEMGSKRCEHFEI